MSDPFLDDYLVRERLTQEWRQHGKIIIAYDFDNTVFDYYRKGYTYNDVISLLRKCKDIGADFIVFTSKAPEEYPEMVKYLEDNDIPFDKINENLGFIPYNGRKVYYNILLDDRAGLRSAYVNLLIVAREIEKGRF